MKRLLIVDDAAFMRMVLRNIVEKNGYEIVGEAKNGIEAVKKYFELRPDIVTMDITMPEMTGIEALKIIKQQDKDAKIIMVSAMGQEPIVKETLIYGAKSFIVKPFNEERVLDTLENVAAM